MTTLQMFAFSFLLRLLTAWYPVTTFPDTKVCKSLLQKVTWVWQLPRSMPITVLRGMSLSFPLEFCKLRSMRKTTSRLVVLHVACENRQQWHRLQGARVCMRTYLWAHTHTCVSACMRACVRECVRVAIWCSGLCNRFSNRNIAGSIPAEYGFMRLSSSLSLGGYQQPNVYVWVCVVG